MKRGVCTSRFILILTSIFEGGLVHWTALIKKLSFVWSFGNIHTEKANLIVGKTTLLEILAIYFNGGLQGIVEEILRDKKNYYDDLYRP